MSIWNSVMGFVKTARHVEHQKSDFVLLIVLVGCAFDLVNVTATISSMSEIQRHFDATYSSASWVLSAYAVAFSGFIAVSGRIGDIVGHANLYIWSSVFFAVFSLLCGAVDSLTALIVFRTLQGVAAAAIVPSGYAIVARSFPPEKLGSRFSVLAAGFSLSFGVGYIVGGAFDLTSVGYKGIYYLSGGVMFVDACYHARCGRLYRGRRGLELAENVSPAASGRNSVRGVLFLEHQHFGAHPGKRQALQADDPAHAQVAADDAGAGVHFGGCVRELLHAVCDHLAVRGIFPVRGAKFAATIRSQTGTQPGRHVRRDDAAVREKRHSVAVRLVHAGLLGRRGLDGALRNMEQQPQPFLLAVDSADAGAVVRWQQLFLPALAQRAHRRRRARGARPCVGRDADVWPGRRESVFRGGHVGAGQRRQDGRKIPHLRLRADRGGLCGLAVLSCGVYTRPQDERKNPRRIVTPPWHRTSGRKTGHRGRSWSGSRSGAARQSAGSAALQARAACPKSV
ncbi:hypothetical protein KL909_003202 [Ogataea angusta]|nr:hypothetical protein KL909_003202 [Ogataea angusta]